MICILFWSTVWRAVFYQGVLAAHLNSDQTEQLFVSGLLHDLGRLILYIHFPIESRHIIDRARIRSNLLYNEESDYLGCHHAEIGKLLMQQWKLPSIIENIVDYHHNPSEAEQPVAATIVHLADIIANSLGIGSSGEIFIPPLDNTAWENLELSVSSFEKLIGIAAHQYKALETILHV